MKIRLKQKKEYIGKEFIITPITGKKGLAGIVNELPGMSNEIKKGGFKGNEGEKLICSPGNKNILLIGTGAPLKEDLTRKLSKNVLTIIKEFKLKKPVIDVSGIEAGNDNVISNFIDYLFLNIYAFDKYIKSENRFAPESMIILVNDKKRFMRILNERKKISGIVDYVRDLINETPSIVTPEYMKNKALSVSEVRNIKIEVFDHKKLKKEKLNGLLNVGTGSEHKPLLVKMSYVPGKYKQTVAIVGKGITYDSGGLNIKPGSHMSTMKSDMSGSAVALGIINLASLMNLPVKIVSYLPLAENMPSERSYKPDDIITFRNGKSVEIFNTDAEGRLVLADAIIMASEEKPDFLVELSTLTGSIVSALGNSFAGVFSMNRDLLKKLEAAGERTGEYLWEMPLYKNYKSSIKSKIADLKNAGYGNASSIKAGLFLNEFSGSTPFAHIDIAGTAFIEKENEYFSTTGATGFGVRLIFNFLKSIS
ncbi:MAG: leucyl aminopeptidase family protein [Acidobacteriota bacterium]